MSNAEKFVEAVDQFNQAVRDFKAAVWAEIEKLLDRLP